MILFYGDPHGKFGPLISEWEKVRPDHIVIVGDFDLEEPITRVLAPLFAAGAAVWWLMGNHDADNDVWYRNLAESLPEGNLSGRVLDMGGLNVAGLGGVYRGKIWRPGDEAARFPSRAAFLKTLRKWELWKGGLPRRHRATIFPEDHDGLARQRADILVTHEAPSSHEPGGFAAIDDLAGRMGVRLIVHGHHHRSYEAVLPNGIRVKGLGLAEPWTFNGFG